MLQINEEMYISVAGVVKTGFFYGKKKRHLESYLIPNIKVDFRPGGKL